MTPKMAWPLPTFRAAVLLFSSVIRTYAIVRIDETKILVPKALDLAEMLDRKKYFINLV